MIASTQLNSSDMPQTSNKEPRYSPVESADRPMGANAATPMMVAASSGKRVLATAETADSLGVSPCLMRVIMPSVTTMALSTSIPIAIIMAPSEIRCSSIPRAAMMPIVPVTVSISTAPTMTPARQPMNRHSAMMTVVIDAMRLTRNWLIARSTS